MQFLHSSSPPSVENEADRLQTLQSYRLLDTLPEQALDDLTALAAHICGTPISLISLVAEDRQWFKSKVGIEVNETPRDISFCAHTLAPREMLVVNDAKLDARFANNPLVTQDPHVRFYAGAPLISPDDHVLGTLCVIDHEPRTLTEAQLSALRTLSHQVMAQIELRRQTLRLRKSESLFRNVFDHASVGICVVDVKTGSFLEVNQHFCDFLGYTESELLDQTFAAITHFEDVPGSLEKLKGFQSGQYSEFRMEKRYLRKDGRKVWGDLNVAAVYGSKQDSPISIGIIEDITERKAAEELTKSHNQVLKMIASGATLHEILDALLLIIESQSPGTPCSILLLDQTGKHLNHGSAIGLDDAYIRAIDGVEIGPNVGSCGTAAYLEEAIFVQDIDQDRRWENFRALAAEHNLKACWSTPIFNENKELFGTMAIYSRQTGLPTSKQNGLIELATQIAAIAISRDRHEASLRASEERFRTTMDNMMEGCQLIGFDWRYLYLNEKYSVQVRRPGAELIGQRIPDAWPRIETTEFYGILKQSMEDRVEINQEVKFEFADGNSSWFEVRCQPVPEGVFVLSIDITERKHAELALADSESKFETAFRVSPAPMFLSDSRGTYLDVNQNACDLLGYTKEEFIGKTALEIGMVNEEMIKIHDEMRARQGRNLKGVEIALLAKDGSPRHFLFSQDSIMIGSREMCLSVGVDITERRKADNELLATQRNLSSIIQSVDGIVWEADAETFRFTYVSPQAERLLGHPVDEWLHSDTFWSDHIHPEDREKAVTYCVECTQNKTDHEFEYRMRKSDGEYLLLRDIVTVIVEEGRPVKLRGLMVDITEQHVLQERLRESQKMEAVGQLAGGIAHDFNNILAAMMMQTDLVMNSEGLSKEARALMEELKSSTKRAAALTSQLLAFGRRQVLQKKTINVNESVKNISKMLLRVLPENVQLAIHLPADTLLTYADSGMFDQVVLNLVVNARDAMSEGGSINITCSEVHLNADEANEIVGAAAGDYVKVTVSDTGTGIPEKTLPHLFEPFFTTKEVGKGTGLGLATVFGILKQHNGAIKVESSPSQGSAFHVYWPTFVEENPRPAKDDISAPSARGHETILIVEDEPSVRSMTKILLQNQGYRILEAENGVEALDIWNRKGQDIQLVLTDMIMPEGVSGKMLADTLRREDPRLKIIFTSGYSPEISGQELQLDHGQRFIPKPCPIQELLATVRSCLDEAFPEED